MACVRKDNDWETIECSYCTFPPYYSYRAAVLHGVAFREMRHDQYHKVANGYQRNNAGILQRVKSPQE